MSSMVGLRSTSCKVLSLLLFTGMMPSQAASPSFTSRYTDLEKDCDTPKWGAEDIAAWERKHPGEEYPYPEPEIMDCKPVAGWRASMSWSTVAMTLSVGPQKRGRSHTEDIPIGMRLAAGTKYAPLEWRIAGGKPFAVIFRVEE